MGKELKYKFYFRKSSFKKDYQNAVLFLELLNKYKPKNFLEVGVLEGATSRNVCELLYKYHHYNFKYVGIDLFGLDKEVNNLKESTPISNKFSNPFKFIYFNFILKSHPNTIKAVHFLLRKFQNSVKLYKGYSKDILFNIDIADIDFCFLDGGHSYETVKEDLKILIKKLKKGSKILVDDYNHKGYGVKRAVDEIKDKFTNSVIGRFILIEI